MIAQDELKNVLHYNPETGIFTWRVNRGPAKIGDVSGCPDKSGYIVIGLSGKRYKAHRLSWLYCYGEFPPSQIDHINRVKSDNRIANLRLATNAENKQNTSKQRNNTSGCTGVYFQKNGGKWIAYIKLNNRQIYLGIYNTKEEAILARSSAKKGLHKFNQSDVT